MAALDKILDSMAARKAGLFTLRSGEVALLHAGQGTQPVGSTPLAEERVLAYLRELAGPAERAALAARQPVSFAYRGFAVAVAFPAGGAEAEIRPPASGRASPAELPPAPSCPPPRPRPTTPSTPGPAARPRSTSCSGR